VSGGAAAQLQPVGGGIHNCTRAIIELLSVFQLVFAAFQTTVVAVVVVVVALEQTVRHIKAERQHKKDRKQRKVSTSYSPRISKKEYKYK